MNQQEKEDKLRGAAEKAIGYERHINLTGKEKADAILWHWIQGAKSEAAREYHQQEPKEVDIKSICSKAFAAGRDYQNGEHSEWHGGREHSYPNFKDWFTKQEFPNLQPVDFLKHVVDTYSIHGSNLRRLYSSEYITYSEAYKRWQAALTQNA